MKISSTLAMLDSVIAALNSYVRIKQMIDEAKSKGEDGISIETLESLMTETDRLENEIINS